MAIIVLCPNCSGIMNRRMVYKQIPQTDTVVDVNKKLEEDFNNFKSRNFKEYPFYGAAGTISIGIDSDIVQIVYSCQRCGYIKVKDCP